MQREVLTRLRQACRTIALVLGVASFSFGVSPAAAQGLEPGGDSPSLAKFVRQCETVLAGTVERTWVETDRRVHAPVVRVALKDVRTVKGPKVDRLRISFWPPGAGAASTRAGVPAEFRKGERYVFLISGSVDEERAGYRPITAGTERSFPVLHDSSRGKSLVHDPERRPVARIWRDRLVVVGPPPGPSKAAPDSSKAAPRGTRPAGGAIRMGPRIEVLPMTEDPGTRVSEEEFLRIVRGIVSGRG